MNSTERPILFSGEMVKAILAGTKTQTRRVVKPQPDGAPVCDPDDGKWYVDGGFWCRACPYGVPGDRLWVRETWHPCDGGPPLYAADYIDHGATDQERKAFAGVERWYPGIHLRREDSRIDLEVTAVRVERLHEITDDDVDAEGFGGDTPARAFPHFPWSPGALDGGSSMVECFAEMWDAINASGGGKHRKAVPWSANPWVWVVSFRRVRPT